MKKAELINIFIKAFGYKSYLEIGCQNNVNFNKIQIDLEEKVSVDPDPKANATFPYTSDEFFAASNIILENKVGFDLILIDGLHHAEQVEKDIINSLQVLNPGGLIILHDCNPKEEWEQLVPRQHKVWYGDVWRAFVGFRLKYPDVNAFLVDHDCGLGIIRHTTQKIEPGFVTDISWQEFNNNRKQLLGII